MSIVELAALAAFFVDKTLDASWRHHGIGVLQRYVREDVAHEVRVHVWHPDLVRPGITERGAVHDHRFDLESRVIVGRIGELIYETEEVPGGGWQPWLVENARSAGPAKGYDGRCVPHGPEMSAKILSRQHEPGSWYELPRGTFHQTIVTELAVTICTMHHKRGQARLLVPAGEEPVHAFGTPASPEVVSRVLDEARHALRDVVARGGVRR